MEIANAVAETYIHGRIEIRALEGLVVRACLPVQARSLAMLTRLTVGSMQGEENEDGKRQQAAPSRPGPPCDWRILVVQQRSFLVHLASLQVLSQRQEVERYRRDGRKRQRIRTRNRSTTLQNPLSRSDTASNLRVHSGVASYSAPANLQRTPPKQIFHAQLRGRLS